MRSFLETSRCPGGAIFLSGSASNAEKLLQHVKRQESPTWQPKVLVTDRPETSRAREVATAYDLPLIEHDIKTYYLERGESRVSLMTERGREIREHWTDALRDMLSPYRIDFGILAGFIPLTNLTGDFPCLNVHPGDLTVEVDGRRLLVGLNTIPIEAAILAGHDSLRSSVIIAQPYTGMGGEMDSGPVLGISSPVAIDLGDLNLAECKQIAAERPDKRPVGGYKDRLEDLAKVNQKRLKEGGDWVVFPPAVADFAAGRFKVDEQQQLYYHSSGDWEPVRSVVYDGVSATPLP